MKQQRQRRLRQLQQVHAHCCRAVLASTRGYWWLVEGVSSCSPLGC